MSNTSSVAGAGRLLHPRGGVRIWPGEGSESGQGRGQNLATNLKEEPQRITLTPFGLVCAAPLRSDRRTVGPWSSPWPVVQLVHESKDEEMVRWLVTYLALVDPWSPDRVGAFRDTFVVLALPCCTETEPDLENFLALVPSNGLGCGYVGLIVSSWSTLTREGWASATGGAHPRKATRRLVDSRTGAGVCAGLGGVPKGPQIASCGLGWFWG